jgi:hypothetical protein
MECNVASHKRLNVAHSLLLFEQPLFKLKHISVGDLTSRYARHPNLEKKPRISKFPERLWGR